VGVRVRFKREVVFEYIESNPGSSTNRRSASATPDNTMPGVPGRSPRTDVPGGAGANLRKALWVVARLIAVPVLPSIYILAKMMLELDSLDRIIILFLTLLTIGLLFPSSREWVRQIGGLLGRMSTAEENEPADRDTAPTA
jgi:hypothetical protein